MNLDARVVAVGLIGFVACGPRTPPSDSSVAEASAIDAIDEPTLDALPVADAAAPEASLQDASAADAGACRGAGPHRSMLDLRYHAVAGVDPDLLSVDLYLPSLGAGCPPPPLVVYVHGGAWVVGDKRSQIATKVAYFAAEGMAFASLNYRLSPSPSRPMGVQYPTHNQDVARAIAWLRERAGMYRYRAERITLFGHSTGAAIATSVGTDPQFLAEHGRTLADLSCVASLDTEAYDVASQIAEGGSSEMIYRNAFGSDPMVWTAASPLLNGTLRASNPLPPFLVVTRGAPSRRALSQRFVDAINASGSMATLHTAEPLTHEGVNAAIGDARDTAVMPAFGPFIERCAR